ncbi:RDD family protein [Streptomyces fradiae]|uniref:RDD family protein n=1 Tax=Streptomyces fradiae TaxID=1906 RepID=UPI00294363DF|nr:RDD family protein [Streptomyces fradiae]WOI59217.1 RDD family protein [Streptomyces fradiae]
MSAPTPATGDGSPEAGYYPDPSIPGYIRYWNGAAWVPGTSRPAPGEGEAEPGPPAPAASPRTGAPAPVPAVEETGPVFLDEEPGIASESGPGAEAEGGPETGGAPEPASAWQADLSRQRGVDGGPDVAWGTPGQADPRVPAARGPAGTALPAARRGEPGPEPHTGPESTANGRSPGGPDGADPHGLRSQPGPQTQGPQVQPRAAYGPSGGPSAPEHHAAATQPAQAPSPQAQASQVQAQAQVQQAQVHGQAPAPTAPVEPHTPLHPQPTSHPSPHPSPQPTPQPPPAHLVPPQGAAPAPAHAAPAAGGPGGQAASWAQQVHQLAQPAPVPAPTLPQPGPGAGPADLAAESQPVVPWKPPVSDPFLRAAQERAAARPAGLGRRLAARLVDTLVLGALAGAAATPFVLSAVDHITGKIEQAERSGETVTVWLVDGTTSVQFGIALGILLVLGVLYEAVPTAKWGRTLGKQLCGTEVRGIESHEPPSFGAALRRWLVYGVLGLAAVGVLNVLWCLFDRPWRQCWHDKAAGTFVAGR